LSIRFHDGKLAIVTRFNIDIALGHDT
jgi:hypothetical protein